jgi:hypothetical protein
VATIQSAKEKYARKTANAASKWNAAKGRMNSNYASGVARFLGSAPSATVVSNYSAGINAAQYTGGDPEKWERNYRAAMTGG